MPKEDRSNRLELLQGTLDMLVLYALRPGPQHGYGICHAIRAGSDDVLQVETGSLYPALHRLEEKGWIRAEWKRSLNNQRARYYTLTAAGKKQLATEEHRWNKFTTAVQSFMRSGSEEGALE
jgi:PadR family transcriptional regulator PadR